MTIRAVHVLTFLAALLPAVAVAADPASDPAPDAAVVTTRAGAHDGFGRIVFNWPRPTGFETKLGDRRLTIRFDRPIESAYGDVLEHLYDYVVDVAEAADGRGVSFLLSRAFEVRAEADGRAVIVDLYPRPGRPITVAAGPGAKAAPAVTMRAGTHPTYGRLVFDWRRDVEYEVEQDGERLTVRFAAPARIDTRKAKTRLPPGIADIVVFAGKQETRVDARIPASASVRHFRAGTKVVVDVVYGDDSAKAAAADQPEAEPARTVEAAPAPVPASAPERPKPSAPTAPVKLVTAATTPDPKADTPRAKPPPVLRDGSLLLEVRRTDTGTAIDFHWVEPVPAAAFERAGYLWIVFGVARNAAPERLADEADVILAAQQVPNDRATILRLRPRDGLFPRLSRSGATWTLQLSDGQGGAAGAIVALPQPDAEPPRVLLAVEDAGRRIDLFDPEVGDELYVVPVLASGFGVPDDRNFVDFSILRSVQGVVVRPHRDHLKLEPVRGGIAVTAAGGLSLSSREVTARARRLATLTAPTKATLFDFVVWRGDPELTFREREHRLLRAVAAAPRNGRSAARWELARFYFAHGLAVEALANMTLVAAEDAAAADNPTFRAVRGAARYLAGRVGESADDLLHSDLDRYPDVMPWRGAVHLAQGRVDEADRAFAVGATTIWQFPEAMRTRLLIDWMDAATRAGNTSSFNVAVDALGGLPPSPRIESELDLMQGRIAARNGDHETALRHFTAALTAGYRPTRVEAEIGRINAGLELKQVSEDEAVERLDALRFAWRGDEVEIEVLRRLADLHIERGDYRKGLELMRQIAAIFPDVESASEVTQRMSAVFEQLYLGGEADDLSPISALALYFDFQELTPLGEKGDEMIRRLADRLAEVDLLESAAKLLRHQTDFRLKGAEKARVAARLAVVYLLDRKAAEALAILDATRWPRLEPELAAERRRLRAQALASLDRVDEALTVLKDDDSRAGRLLRADLYWRTQQWPEAAGLLEALLAQAGQGEAPLNESEQTQVVKLAVAYYMADERAALAEMRRLYGAKMEESRRVDAFRLLTNQVDPAQTAFRNLAGAIAGIDQLEAFMASYRSRMADAGLSAIN